ncbi:uracil-DNA glycosylase [Henriciella marina]|uniref:uracil-DNA glycosylase n=1 Tax=Henriciella marina TaxID=453851 RepID=UPI00036ABAC4|nr:uracil-DNA glycosylase [Henriciella marina]
MSQPQQIQALEALRDWWAEMGVEADEAEIRALTKAARANAAPEDAASPARRPRTIPREKRHEDWVEEARNLSRAAASFSDLKSAIEGFDGCLLKEAARHAACFDGVEGAPVMVIGEGPGAEEDKQGLPFVGRAGQLLDRMLGAIGLSRATNVFITNVNYWRPPGNRNPSDEELALCRPFVDRMIEIGQPKLIIAAGGVSAKSLLQASIGIMKLRGTEQKLETPGGYSAPLFPIFHPAFLLRRPEEKSRAWRDLLQIQERFEALS